MIKKLLGLTGLLVFIIALILRNQISNSQQLAMSLDDQEHSNAVVEGPPPCTWTVIEPDRVMTENRSQAVSIEVSNSLAEECESYLSLRAPGFDFSPAREEQKINLKSNDSGSLSWILTPRKTGTYDLAISDMIDTKIFGITVTNMFGLPAIYAKIFSMVGGILGPMLTVPWWWDRWQQWKQRPAVNKKVEPEPKPEPKATKS